MGISPRALSHYLAKYPFIDQSKAQGAQLSSVAEGLRKRHLARIHGVLEVSSIVPSPDDESSRNRALA